ncbi:MAG: urocanate hydratase, partial [Candidatus Aminicenantes bacterium]|nr:urocanate hydratase [Candidatus Aminicenantes bacterium]
MIKNEIIAKAMTIKMDRRLPEKPTFTEGIRRAPDRGFTLNQKDTEIALKNALRYIPEDFHAVLAPEF